MRPMSPTLSYKSYRIDEHSQRILLRLLEADGAVGTGELTKASGFEEGAYSKVKYRIDTHLKPAGFVTELDDRTDSGWDGPRHFEITRTGEWWVAEQQDQLGELRTVDGIASDTAEALEAAESARDSVQSYRRKVYRLKRRVEDVEDDMDELDDRMDDVETERQSMLMTLSIIHEESPTEEDLEAVAERVAATEESVAATEERVVETEKGLAELQSRVFELEEEVEQLAVDQCRIMEEINEAFEEIGRRLDQLDQEDSGILDRLSPFR
jgi:phage shock protein A